MPDYTKPIMTTAAFHGITIVNVYVRAFITVTFFGGIYPNENLC